ncbi:hypothetical protein ACFV6F_01825 [Kitasatospora phosalacinea]|uniref:hypothetical protein n=1 Tax=Kitasatospora phosalacinea TaxID=2065 RepID=UPI0036574D09
MHGFTDLNQIVHRLTSVELDPWGPDGVRYVCILLWDHQGYRRLGNEIDAATWLRWDTSSGQFWDLFLAGCTYGDQRHRENPDLPLGVDGRDEVGPRSHWTYSWSASAAARIAAALAQKAAQAGAPHWKFTGPLELVTVGARRVEGEVVIDWAGLRSAQVTANVLPTAVSDYTEAHVTLDGDVVPDEFPTPGSFEDDLLPELKRDLARKVSLLRFLFH